MKNLTILLALIGSALVLNLIACGNGDNEVTFAPAAQPSTIITTEHQVSLEPVEITIGNLTDITGPSANVQIIINTALGDLVEYYNTEDLIPGVKLEVVTYDGQLDPSKDVSGYEKLKDLGADLIFTSAPGTPLTLQPIVNKETMLLFAATGYHEQLDPPGYVFVLGTIPEHQAYTILNWIAGNDWDYRSNGPAKIGGASWPDDYSRSFLAAIKHYAEVNPDQFEWEGGYSSAFKFTWDSEVEALKDCDYIFPCVNPVQFVKEYRSAGHIAKFIFIDAHTGFLSLISDANLWDEIDGSLVIRGGSVWWNEEGPMIDLNKKLLYENHPDKVEEIMQAGNGYLTISGIFYPMFEIIADAVEAVGAENFDSQALYDAAQSYSLVIDGVERSGFTETKRYALSNYIIEKASAANEDIIRVNAAEKWIPHLVEP